MVILIIGIIIGFIIYGCFADLYGRLKNVARETQKIANDHEERISVLEQRTPSHQASQGRQEFYDDGSFSGKEDSVLKLG